MSKQPTDPRFNDFLLKKALEALGGEQVAYEKFYGAKVKQAVQSGQTFGDLLALADTEEWRDQLLGMKLSILGSADSPATTPSGRKTRNPADSGAILAFIANNPGCKAKAIKEGVSGNIGTKVSDLVKANLVHKEGDKAATTYSITAEGQRAL